MKTRTLVDNRWVYEPTDRMPEVGEKIQFTCNGRGRGGHCNVTAIITAVKRKTVDATEAERSYREGTKWNVKIDDLMVLL
jgi:hypothetical protein